MSDYKEIRVKNAWLSYFFVSSFYFILSKIQLQVLSDSDSLHGDSGICLV
jgi:hypothetical protein